MNTFDIFGILFLIIGGLQSLISLLWIKKHPSSFLFLVMGILFLVVGIWMLKL
ncbi:DUF308 domain-containing protein [Kiritimatiellota bacterium B12222]|nr:DUF308 domain-containing protein [Kiritimatiellota bacterium B12222]